MIRLIKQNAHYQILPSSPLPILALKELLENEMTVLYILTRILKP